MSEWMTPPQSAEYRTPTDGLGVLRKMLTDLSRRISALEGTAPLKQAGIYLTTLGMRIASSLTVEGDLTSTGSADITGTTHIGGATDIDGTLNVDAATTIGGTLGVTGATTLGSTLALTGNGTVSGLLQSSNFVAGVSGWRLTSTGLEVNTLTAKDAIIGNAALTSPVEVGDFNHTETGFDPVAGAWATVSSVTLTVPAGFTEAVVTAIAYAGITGAGGDIHCRATVAGVGGPADTRSTSPSQWRPVLSMFSHRVTGLTGGGTVAVACQAYVATDVAADAANTATVSGTVLWLR